jgi:prevent-host-death family protein
MELSVAEAKDQFSKCLTRAQAGETVIVRKHGKAVAQIVGIPNEPKNQIKLGCGRGSVKVLGDLTEPAFDSDDWECL